eukprot:874512-Prymnesium_polylepis.1
MARPFCAIRRIGRYTRACGASGTIYVTLKTLTYVVECASGGAGRNLRVEVVDAAGQGPAETQGETATWGNYKYPASIKTRDARNPVR